MNAKPDSALQVDAFIGLGSNLGNRSAHIQQAIKSIDQIQHTDVLTGSDIIETEPMGPIDQDRFLNAVVMVRTSLEPRVLLDELLLIETAQGRVRSERWGPRTLDLDLLIHGSTLINEQGLCVPHPELASRLFVLVPLMQIAPNLIVPGLDQSVRTIVDHLHQMSNQKPLSGACDV